VAYCSTLHTVSTRVRYSHSAVPVLHVPCQQCNLHTSLLQSILPSTPRFTPRSLLTGLTPKAPVQSRIVLAPTSNSKPGPPPSPQKRKSTVEEAGDHRSQGKKAIKGKKKRREREEKKRKEKTYSYCILMLEASPTPASC